MTKSEIANLNFRTTEDFCAFAEKLGYKQTGRFACNQLQNNNGFYVSSLINMLDDNPGILEVIKDWLSERGEPEDRRASRPKRPHRASWRQHAGIRGGAEQARTVCPAWL